MKAVSYASSPTHKLRLLVPALLLITGIASAAPTIHIWKSRGVGSFGDYWFYVSTGTTKTPTPTGKYTVKKKVIDYWSKKYDRAMPYAVFFTDAHAIHAGDLTTPSKGCIRVDYPTAEFLYSYANSGKTRVVVHP